MRRFDGKAFDFTGCKKLVNGPCKSTSKTKTMKRYTLSLDLVDDPLLIEEYENWHRSENIWPEIKKSIKESGIANMEIYRTGSRLCMIIETTDDFTFEKKEAMDAANPKVQEWEALMSTFQQPLPWAKRGEKWILMEKIFQI